MKKLVKAGLDLVEDASGAEIWCDRETVALKDFAFFVASNDLNFSSANLDSEEGVTLHLK